MTAEPRASAREEASRLQRDGADPDVSAWVAASAGSGKTTLLVDRVLRLLLAGNAPDKILCLTYTRAAAAQMLNKVSEVLSKWASCDDPALDAEFERLLGRQPAAPIRKSARQLFARVLDAPGGMRVMTIHAFCQSLLRRFPLEAGVAPQFQLVEERDAAQLLSEAMKSVLLQAAAHPHSPVGRAVAAVTARIGELEFGTLMKQLRAARSRLRRHLDREGGVDGAIRLLRERLGVTNEDTVDGVLKSACAAAAFEEAALRRAAQALLAGSKTDIAAGERLMTWLAADEATRVAMIDRYALAFLTQKGQMRARLATASAAKLMPDIPATLASEAKRIVALRAKCAAIRLVEATEALLVLGSAVLDNYAARKAARAGLDYDDLVARALALLEDAGAAWVHYKLDGGIDHVLVDEAQDTSPDQWRIVQALTTEFFAGKGVEREGAPRTMFAVGDRKQSIFSFQGADPDAFDAMRRWFAQRIEEVGEGLRVVPLDVSFRSVETVLDAVDNVFSDAEAARGVVEGAEAGRLLEHLPARTGQAGHVELWPLALPRDIAEPDAWAPPVDRYAGDSPRERMARATAGHIANLIRSGERLDSHDRPVQAGDILVLVRTRNEFLAALVRELKERDIAVAGIDRMNLSSQIAVMDLVVLAQFLLHAEDDLALATVLRGPLVDLSDADLFELAWQRPGSLWHSLARRREEKPSFAKAYGFLAPLLNATDYLPPFELFQMALGRNGNAKPTEAGRRAMIARLGHDAADPLDEFLALALDYDRRHAPSLQGFLTWFAASETEIKRDLDQGNRDQVRIMTVHGAKGLEAPIVYLPDTTAQPRDSERLLWFGDEPGSNLQGGLLWAPRRDDEEGMAGDLRAKLAEAREAEYRRLLYVAMTRAEDRLYVGGWQDNAREIPSGCWYRLVERGMQEAGEAFAFDNRALFRNPAEGWDGDGYRRTAVRKENVLPDKVQKSSPPPGDVALPDWAQHLPPPERKPLRPLAPSRPAEAPAARSPLGADRGTIFRRGLIVHRLLELLPNLQPDQRSAAGARFLANPTHRLDAPAQRALLDETMTILDAPDLAWMFGPDSLAELPLAGELTMPDGTLQAVSGQIDRIAIDATRVAIVDYKTLRPVPPDVDAVPIAYRRQLASYRALARAIWPGRRVECWLLWTEGPLAMNLSDALLDAALAHPHSPMANE
jgi:ATP-dependent helicase/nuclease subunit A